MLASHRLIWADADINAEDDATEPQLTSVLCARSCEESGGNACVSELNMFKALGIKIHDTRVGVSNVYAFLICLRHACSV